MVQSVLRRPYALLLIGALLLGANAFAPSTGAAQQPCEFQLGFLAIKQQIPDEVGNCLENEHFNTANGNSEQRTTARGAGGLLVWRKSDNWTAYTDGYRTWVNGPFGLEERLNTERFPWENDPVVTPTPVPTAVPVTPTPNVPTVYLTWSIDGSGNPVGYWRDQNGVVSNFGVGNYTIIVRYGDQIVLDPTADQFSFLFDCGPSNPAVQPCNFNSSAKGSTPVLKVVNRDPIGGFITISKPNNFGGQRPDNSSRYVNDPKVTIFINPNPR
jgi:hypothetical protein